MKTLTSIFMILAILAGLILALTPFVADKFFPVPKTAVRQAKPEAAAMALKRWFKSPNAPFIDVQAINNVSSGHSTVWFSFSVGRQPVEKYIIEKKLEQKALTKETLNKEFFQNNPPASWWQPTAIVQETYFSGRDQGRLVSLLYSPKSKRGVLVTTTKQDN